MHAKTFLENCPAYRGDFAENESAESQKSYP